jgi:hypothetical protein
MTNFVLQHFPSRKETVSPWRLYKKHDMSIGLPVLRSALDEELVRVLVAYSPEVVTLGRRNYARPSTACLERRLVCDQPDGKCRPLLQRLSTMKAAIKGGRWW